MMEITTWLLRYTSIGPGQGREAAVWGPLLCLAFIPLFPENKKGLV